jgi:uncharacterized protein YkwD
MVAVALLVVAAGVGLWQMFGNRNTNTSPDLAVVDTATGVAATDQPPVPLGEAPVPSTAPAESTPVGTSTAAGVVPTEIPTDEPPTPEVTATPTTAPTPQPFVAEDVQRLLLDLVNADREAAGNQPLIWDSIAAAAGQRHAVEMADLGYLSHWNADGYGPDYRYTAAGGLHKVQENVYSLSVRHSDGSGAPIADWSEVARLAQASLMDSEGHRANILAPEHTHVGIGVAYQPATGEVRIAQEFVNQYLDIQMPPLRAAVGDQFIVRGTLRPGTTNLLVNVAYEPFPEPLAIEELNRRSTYTSPAVFVNEPSISLDGSDFIVELSLPPGGLPGLYHLQMWADTTDFAQVPVAEIVITVN